MNEHLPSADPERTNLREPSAEPGTTDATADATDPRLAGWMDELRQMMGTDASADATNPLPTDPPPGSPDVPGYRVTGEIAKGGMGRVYAAVDLTLDREVAIKTLLPGANAERFVTESKITAKLPHPNIPPVHELGSLPDGTPFLVMKLVRGATLAEQLKARPNLSHDLSRFVQIFEQIAQAVGFAHSRGVIHRDLKPLNVMVGEFGEVQVMDWGLAKMASGGREAAGSAREQPAHAGRSPDADLTAAGAVLGTPAYMAPEQARGEPLDPRADVFALGATLAVILTGKPAFVGTSLVDTIQKATKAELADVFARVESCGADIELVTLAKSCLSADRDSRPADGRAVATEVATYRAGVEARLRLAETQRAEAVVREAEQRKRRRQFTIAAGVVAAVLLAGIVGTAVGLVVAVDRANREEQAKIAEGRAKEAATTAEEEAKANARQARGERDAKDVALKAEEKAKDQALTNLDFSRKANTILASVFGDLRPEEIAKSSRPLQDVLKDNLKLAVKVLDGTAIGDPLVVAEMQYILGASLIALGEAELAMEILEKAHATRLRTLGVDHPDTFKSMNSLAVASQVAGKRDRALPLFEEALRLMKAKVGPDHPDTLSIMSNLAFAYQAAGKRDQALPLFEEAVSLRRAKFGPDHSDTLDSIAGLAEGYLTAGKLDQALPLLEEACSLRKAKLGPDHPDTLISMTGLAQGYRAAGKLDQAMPLFEETLKLSKTKLGPDHPRTLNSMHNLAFAYRAAGRLDKALPLAEETFNLMKGKLGPDHPSTLVSMSHLAEVNRAANQLDKALPLFEETFKLMKAKLGSDHPDTLVSMGGLAEGYRSAAKLDKALPLAEETLKLMKAKLGPDHPETLKCMNNLAMGYRDARKLDKAMPLFEETLKLTKSKLGSDHPETLNSMNNLAACYWSMKRLDQSVPLFEELLPLKERKLGRQNLDTQVTVANLGVNYKDASRLKDAIPLLEEAHGASKTYASLRWVSKQLIDAYEKAGESAKLTNLFKEQLSESRKFLPKDSPQLFGQLVTSGLKLLELKEWAAAEEMLRECLTMQEKVKPDDWSTFVMQSKLGEALVGQKKYTDAERLLVKGYEGMKKREKEIPPSATTSIPEALDQLVTLYTATEKPDEVKKYQELRAKYPAAKKEVLPPPRADK